MTMRDLFKDDNDEIIEPEEQPMLTEGEEGGEERPIDGGIGYDDGTGVAPGAGDGTLVPHDFRYVDRFVKVKGLPQPAKNSKEESNFLLSDSFAEQFVINFLSDRDQRNIWRSLADIMDQAEGEGNGKVALQDAKLLAARILMKRSSTENTLALNERTAHIEQRSRQSIVQRGEPLRQTATGGWLARLFGR